MQRQIDRASFAIAMVGANPEFEKRFDRSRTDRTNREGAATCAAQFGAESPHDPPPRRFEPADSLGAQADFWRIRGGTAVLLLAALAFVAVRGIDAAGAERFSLDSARSTASAEVAIQVGEARALVVQYALTATPDDQKTAQASLTRLDQAIVRSAAATRTAICRSLQRAIALPLSSPQPSRAGPVSNTC